MTAKSTYQIFIIAPELMADRTLSLTARVVLGRLGGYTKRGQQTCWPTNQALADECGLAIHSVSNAIKELCQRHIIETKNSLYKGKKTRYITIVFNSPAYDSKTAYISDSSSNELSSNENSINEQSNSSSNELSENSSNELSYIYTEESTKEVQKDRENTPSQKTKKVLYPKSEDECLKIFEPVFNKLCDKYPALATFDVNIQSDKFFSYYTERDWKTKAGVVKNVSARIRTWLLRELENKPAVATKKQTSLDWAERLVNHTDSNQNAVVADYEVVNDELLLEKRD